MKRVFSILAVLALIFAVGCKKDPQGDNNPDSQSASIVFDDDTTPSLVLDVDGSWVSFGFTATAEWTIEKSDDAEWLTLNKTSGNAGKNSIIVTASRNSSFDDRFAELSIRCGDAEAKIPVRQESSDAPEVKVTFKWPNNEAADGIQRAFPGAEGAGMYTTGGRGGKVIHVTNLNDSGEGSLRAALNEKGARTIVFDVAGVIDLKSNLNIQNGDVTIAGQTAPGDGICLKNHTMQVKASNVIIRYIRFRPGDSSGDDGLDAIWGRYFEHIILDHCSMSWSTDECSSFYANRNFTMQWCLLGESLHNTAHSKGSHGYGGIWGGAPASFHHNLLAHHDSRNPRFDSPNTYAPNSKDNPTMSVDDRRIDYRNNIVYNFCNYPAYGGEGQRINFVGNIYKWGPASVNGAGISFKDGVQNANKINKRPWFYSVDGSYTSNDVTYDYGWATLYIGDNTNLFDSSADGNNSVGDKLTANNKEGFIKAGSSTKNSDIQWTDTPLSIQDGSQNCWVTTHSASTLMDVLCRYVGASKMRDRVDEHIAQDTKAGTATYSKGSNGSQYGIIDSQEDVGGWPNYAATEDELKLTVDTDGDGIPDYYESLFGLDPNNAADGNDYTLDSRYTNLEMYLHYLVQDTIAAQVEGGLNTELK